MAVNLKIVSQVATSGIPGPVGKSAYQIAVDNGFEGTESEWLKQLLPFKGWYDSVSDLEIAHANPILGDYAYVKGATSSDPIKIYECSTEGSWSDSGRTVDTSTVQTFGSGEAVNDVNITDDSSDIEENNDKIPTAGAVADALGNAEFSTGEKVKNVGIDAEPTTGSDNLVKSGGVQKELALGAVYDVSAKNPTAGPNNDGKWESLSALLSDANLSTLIPSSVRKGGMSVKFIQSSNNNYVQWRLVSKDWSIDTNNWVAENEDFRDEVMRDVNEAIASIAPIKITGDVTNAADEEDLTSVSVGGTDVLKFKDKVYSPLTYSGLGRVYLRKNIVNGVNVLTQEMMPIAENDGEEDPGKNTIYVIQYDYDLDGEDITVPEGCTLEFDGGSLKNGTIIFSNSVISSDKTYQAFYNITLKGTIKNEMLNVILFGILPDRSDIDATPILQKIDSYLGKFFFPAGKYYFSEYYYGYRGSEDKFALYGCDDDGLNGKTMFYPFYQSQRYIMKLGGSEPTKITISNCAFNVTIMNITFVTPSGYKPIDMEITHAGVSAEYSHAALVLDGIEIGKFGVNGKVHNTPFIMMGYVNEANFDYITCYTTFGSSTLPVINIITGNQRTITATKINRLECETISGPVITANPGTTCSELYINTFNYEGTKMFGSNRENLQDEQRYTGRIDLSNYRCVPIFDLKGIAIKIFVNYTSITSSNNTWINTLDDDPSVRCTTTFVNTIGYGGRLSFNSIENNYISSYLYITGGAFLQPSDVIKVIKASGIVFVATPLSGKYLSLDIPRQYFNDSDPIQVENIEYRGEDLRKISRQIKDSSNNLLGVICTDTNGDTLTVYKSTPNANSYTININGLKLPGDTKYIKMAFYVVHNFNNFTYSFEYYTYNANSPVYTENVSKTVTKNTIANITYAVNTAVTFDYIKIKKVSAGYSSFIVSLGFSPITDEYINNYANIHRERINRKVTGSIINFSSSAPYVADNPFSTGVFCYIERLLYVNKPITVKFLKENNFSSADAITYTLDTGVDFLNIIAPDKTVYGYIGFQTNGSGTRIQYGEYVLSDTEYDGAKVNVRRYGFDPDNPNYYSLFTARPTKEKIYVGFNYFDLTVNKPNWWTGSKWIESDGAKAGVKRSGNFANKPAAADIYVGFKYFCTDKQTTEGATDGIEIIHKGSDVWVDALGRIVS